MKVQSDKSFIIWKRRIVNLNKKNSAKQFRFWRENTLKFWREKVFLGRALKKKVGQSVKGDLPVGRKGMAGSVGAFSSILALTAGGCVTNV